MRQRVEVLEGDGVLGVDPLLHLRRVEVLHPAVGIGDLRAEVVVDDVAFARRGICIRRRLRQRRRGQGKEGTDNGQLLHREHCSGAARIAFQYEIADTLYGDPIRQAQG